MSYDMVKYERGQIWIIRFKYDESNGHEIKKDRPYLILSDRKHNQSSGMITGVPITTRDQTVTPAQVSLMMNGRQRVILCEQIRSFDTNSGNYIMDYIGAVSDEVLEKVDVALSIHLGMHYSPITLRKLQDSMEAIIKSVGHMQKRVESPVFTDDDVLQFAEKLQMLASNSANSEISATEEVVFDLDSITPLSRVCTMEYNKPHMPEQDMDISRTIRLEKINPVKEEYKKVRSKKHRWTQDKKEEFLSDLDKLTIEEIMKKYEIATRSSYYSMKYYVLNS